MSAKPFATGRCLCGAVTYTINAAPLAMGQCHCKDCQQSSGTGHMSLAFFKKADVEVKGTLCTGGGNPVCGTLTATKVEPERIGIADAAQAEVEGFVTAFTSSASFKIGTQAVVTNSSTCWL